MTPVIGFIGAGQLGEPMVLRLIAAGHDVHVFARRSDVCARLRDSGAFPSASIAELAARSDVLISCVFSDDQLAEITAGPRGILVNSKDGAVLVSHTTGRASTLTALARQTSRLSIVDAPVSGTAAHVGTGSLTALIGGESAAVHRVKPVLSAYCNPIVETGELGSALNIKLINNLVFAANAQIIAAATELGRRLGVAETRLLDALEMCSGGSRLASYARQFGGVQAFAAGAGQVLRKDVAAATRAAHAAGADLGLLSTVVTLGPLTLTGATT
jgi:3-hydroxyisobutyrate dehydrogenase-like beta-hydroxyacid dehydrogenase